MSLITTILFQRKFECKILKKVNKSLWQTGTWESDLETNTKAENQQKCSGNDAGTQIQPNSQESVCVLLMLHESLNCSVSHRLPASMGSSLPVKHSNRMWGNLNHSNCLPFCRREHCLHQDQSSCRAESCRSVHGGTILPETCSCNHCLILCWQSRPLHWCWVQDGLI
jgi:hypothetical protein